MRYNITVYILFVCVVVMYSGEYDVCDDVTLNVHPHRAG